MNPIMEQLPESKRTEDVEKALEVLGIKDMGSLADGLVKVTGEINTMKGQLGDYEKKVEGLISVPGQDADPSAIASFNQKIGVPANVDGYGIEELKATDEGKEVLNLYLKSGVRKDVANRLTKEMAEFQQRKDQAQIAKQQETVDGYFSGMGEKGPKAKQLAAKAAELIYGGEEKKDARDALLRNPDLVPALVQLGQIQTEHPTMLNSTIRGSASKAMYPSMEERGIK